MRTSRSLNRGIKAAAFATFAAIIPWPSGCTAWQAPTAVQIESNDLGGVVTRRTARRREFAIAETADLPTKFAKIVVTDDQGRYLAPDLPGSHHTVWVRGYGLVDPAKIQTEPGKIADLKATPAPGPPRRRNIILLAYRHGPGFRN